MKTIVITGGAGFIGSHVVRLFVNKYPEYHIINLMGQILLQGFITDETQQINIESLSARMYFICMGGQTVKFVVR